MPGLHSQYGVPLSGFETSIKPRYPIPNARAAYREVFHQHLARKNLLYLDQNTHQSFARRLFLRLRAFPIKIHRREAGDSHLLVRDEAHHKASIISELHPKDIDELLPQAEL